ncbi:MAG TPA: type II and III secretion system protein [Bryobacteraceae bacterium]|nr:type II and III secretion system protein [Bryobacteraceae bacterium]
MAERAFRQGLRAERSGDRLQAYFLYAEAAQEDASNPSYSGRMAALARSGALQPLTAVAPDPANETVAAKLEADGLVGDESFESPAAILPPRLAASPDKHSFRIKGRAREIFEQVAAAYGFHILFDPGYQEPAAFTFAITGADYRDALRALQAASDSFLVPLDETTALVARDTAQNRTQLTPVVALAVPIPERMALQEAQELSTAVQQTLEIRRIGMDAQKRVVYFRDTASKVFTAREMFASLSHLRAQIAVDVELISVSKTSSLSYGLQLPTSASIVDFGSPFATAVSAIPAGSPGIPQPAGASGTCVPLRPSCSRPRPRRQPTSPRYRSASNTRLGIGIANSAAFAALSRASATTLLEAQVTSLDGQATTFKVGDRYPVTTANFTDSSGAAVAGFAPVINYVDLGLALKLTPAVHQGSEVSLDVEAAFTTLAPGGANGIPAIASQQYQGKVRLKDGDWAVVAGLLTTAQTENPTGLLGLANLPWIGHLFRHQQREDDRNEVLLVLKPRLIAAPAWEDDDIAAPIWTGTETRPTTTF